MGEAVNITFLYLNLLILSVPLDVILLFHPVCFAILDALAHHSPTEITNNIDTTLINLRMALPFIWPVQIEYDHFGALSMRI